jgi:lactate racemase
MMGVIGEGAPSAALTRERVTDIVGRGVPASLVEGKRVLVLTPDATRTAPLPLMVRVLGETIAPRASALDFMVALGTHPVMTEEGILSLYGLGAQERARLFPRSRFLSHRWDIPSTLTRIGVMSEGEIEELTGGLFRESIEVTINRSVFDYDLVLILGPVFPHEVIGFSGGNKYLFPGISGGEFLHFFHWLGAVITCWDIIGRKHTPVREAVNRAAGMVKVPRWCLAMVVGSGGELRGLYAGPPEEAWSDAADLSAQIHVTRVPRPFHTVIGVAPRMYDDLWVAGKVMYKLEPVVAEGGRLVILAPHLSAISHTWGKQIGEIGYHVRDYFLGRMERFRGIPRGVLAHSTHVRGLGTFRDGVERPRIEVVLATGIPPETCARINLGYQDPAAALAQAEASRGAEGVLVVPHAGEVLHRLTSDAAGAEGKS